MQITDSVFTPNFILLIVIAASLLATATETKPKYYFEESDAVDHDVRAPFSRNHLANWRAKLAALIYGDGNWSVHIQAYKCSKNSPHKPQWTTTKPKVMWTHIFCGQITSQGKAQGFHSQSTLTGYSVCVAPFGCTYNKPSGNGYCSIVKIRSSDTSGVEKAGGSSMFPKFKGPTDIINIIVQLCKVCKPPIGSKTLCVKGCNYRGNPNKFDIFMIMDNYGNVISAYPRTCSSTPQCTGRCSNL